MEDGRSRGDELIRNCLLGQHKAPSLRPTSMMDLVEEDLEMADGAAQEEEDEDEESEEDEDKEYDDEHPPRINVYPMAKPVVLECTIWRRQPREKSDYYRSDTIQQQSSPAGTRSEGPQSILRQHHLIQVHVCICFHDSCRRRKREKLRNTYNISSPSFCEFCDCLFPACYRDPN
jgi:hypothetical protein